MIVNYLFYSENNSIEFSIAIEKLLEKLVALIDEWQITSFFPVVMLSARLFQIEVLLPNSGQDFSTPWSGFAYACNFN